MLSDKIKSITMTKNELEKDPRYERDDYITGIANGLGVALQILAREDNDEATTINRTITRTVSASAVQTPKLVET